MTLAISTSPISNNRLSRSENPAYHEVKIWSLPKHENLTSCKKIVWKKGEIAPKAFLLFSTIFSIFTISLTSRVHYTYICLMWLIELVFPQFCKSDMSKYGYLEYFRESLGIRDITRFTSMTGV